MTGTPMSHVPPLSSLAPFALPLSDMPDTTTSSARQMLNWFQWFSAVTGGMLKSTNGGTGSVRSGMPSPPPAAGHGGLQQSIPDSTNLQQSVGGGIAGLLPDGIIGGLSGGIMGGTSGFFGQPSDVLRGASGRGTGSFKEQLAVVSGWLEEWSECEQTVALYAILRKLSVRQSRFLEHLLQQASAASEEDSESLDQAENCANSKRQVECLHLLKEEACLSQLLKLFPLLHPGNEPAKGEYLKLIPKVLAKCIENRVKPDDCRHLLTYVLIHPAISNNERTLFTKWLTELEHQYTMQMLNTQLTQNCVQDLSKYVSELDPMHPLGGSETSSPSPTAQRPSNLEKLSSALAAAAVVSGATSNVVVEKHTNEHGHVAGAQGNKRSGSTQAASVGLQGMSTNSAACVTKPAVISSSPASVERSFEPTVCVSPPDPSVGPYRHPHHRPLAPVHSEPAVKFSRMPVQPTSSGGHSVLTRTTSHSLRAAGLLSTNNAGGLGAAVSSGYVGSTSSLGPWGSGFMEDRGHQALSPQSSLSSSGSDHHDDLPGFAKGTGMKDFGGWMKELRLHKYTDYFADMTHEDMLEVTEEWLESKGVTKGARKKLASNIERLKERPACLTRMEQEIPKGTISVLEALKDLRWIATSPIKPYKKSVSASPSKSNLAASATGAEPTGSSSSPPPPKDVSLDEGKGRCSPYEEGEERSEPAVVSRLTPTAGLSEFPDEDLAGKFTRVMGRVCTQLVVMPAKQDPECFSLYAVIADKCMLLEAFLTTHRKSLSSWKSHVQRAAPRHQPNSGGGSLGVGPGSVGYYHGQHPPAHHSLSHHGGGSTSFSSSGAHHAGSGGHTRLGPVKSHTGVMSSGGLGAGGTSGSRSYFGAHQGNGATGQNRGAWQQVSRTRSSKSPLERVRNTSAWTSPPGAGPKRQLVAAYSNPDAVLYLSRGSGTGNGAGTGTGTGAAGGIIPQGNHGTLEVPSHSALQRTSSAPGGGVSGGLRLAPGGGVTPGSSQAAPQRTASGAAVYHHPHRQLTTSVVGNPTYISGGGNSTSRQQSRGGHQMLGRTASHQHHPAHLSLARQPLSATLSAGPLGRGNGTQGGSPPLDEMSGEEADVGGDNSRNSTETEKDRKEAEEVVTGNLHDLCISVTEHALGSIDSSPDGDKNTEGSDSDEV